MEANGSVKKAWAMYYAEQEKVAIAEMEIRKLRNQLKEMNNDKEKREFREFKDREEREFREFIESRRPKPPVMESSVQDKARIRKLELALRAFTVPDKGDTSAISKLKKALNAMVGL